LLIFFNYKLVHWIDFFFFFSSIRLHTSFSRDWSSDVCSSDLRFLPADDPRVRATVLAIADELTEDGLVLRYRVETTDDGLSGKEIGRASCRERVWIWELRVIFNA